MILECCQWTSDLEPSNRPSMSITVNLIVFVRFVCLPDNMKQIASAFRVSIYTIRFRIDRWHQYSFETVADSRL